MNDMQQAVNAAFANVIASGAIEKAIQERVTKTINDLINDQISAHSDFGRQRRDHVKAALQVDFSHLGLPGNNDFLLKIIRGQVEAQLNSSVGKHVETQMAQLLAPAPAQIKLSELVAQFIKDNDESHYGCSCDGPEQITLAVEGSEIPRGYHQVYLDKEEGKAKRSKLQKRMTKACFATSWQAASIPHSKCGPGPRAASGLSMVIAATLPSAVPTQRERRCATNMAS